MSQVSKIARTAIITLFLFSLMVAYSSEPALATTNKKPSRSSEPGTELPSRAIGQLEASYLPPTENSEGQRLETPKLARGLPLSSDVHVSLPRSCTMRVFHWEAPSTYHYPLYFEEVNRERYGYSACSPCLQPVASAALFFARVPLLPLRALEKHPRECVYTLGHYRPGSCVPFRWH